MLTDAGCYFGNADYFGYYSEHKRGIQCYWLYGPVASVAHGKNEFFIFSSLADVAQLVEHVHGKDGVVGSIPTIGSRM